MAQDLGEICIDIDVLILPNHLLFASSIDVLISALYILAQY